MSKVRVPASTSNLGPGFDTLGLALRLYLTVSAERADRLEIEAHGEGAGRLPAGPENLVWQAMQRVAQISGRQLPPQRLRLESEIPLCRGLGSSGAAIAAGLWLANELVAANLDRRQLLNLGAAIEGHPENVSASLFGGLTVNCPSGDGVLTERVDVHEWPEVVLLIPEIEIRTEEARRVLPETIPFEDAVSAVQRTTLLLEAFRSGRFELLRAAMEDPLHQPYRKHLVPGFDAILSAAYDAGAAGVCLSGSGSTILAFVQKDPHAVAQAMHDAAAEAGLLAEARVVRVAEKGVQKTG